MMLDDANFGFWLLSGFGGLLGLYFKKLNKLKKLQTICEKIWFVFMSIVGSFFISYIAFVSSLDILNSPRLSIAAASLIAFLGVDALIDISRSLFDAIHNKIKNIK